MKDCNTNRDVLADVLAGLEGVTRKDPDRYSFHCPLEHRKSNASAEVWLDAEGRIGVCCYDCGRNQELWQRIVSPRIRRVGSRARTTYTYEHPDGAVRLSYRSDGQGGKRIWQPKGQSIHGTYVKLWPPAGGDTGGTVIWVEGELCAAAIAEIGFVGASSIAGAANVGKTDYSPLSNRDVLVWPDDDPAGREAGEVVAHQLAGVGVARVRLATTHQKDDGGDAADLAPDTRLARLRELLESTPDYRCSSDFPLAANSAPVSGKAPKSDWTVLGEICAERLRRQFRFESVDRVWYSWRDGNRWSELTDTAAITDVLHYERLRISAEIGEEGRHELSNLLARAPDWRRETNNLRGEWWAAIRTSLSRPRIAPRSCELATPSGVVDLFSGEIQPHDPLVHDAVAVTRGNYRPQDAGRLRQVLWNRLRHNVSASDFDRPASICTDSCRLLRVSISHEGFTAIIDANRCNRCRSSVNSLQACHNLAPSGTVRIPVKVRVGLPKTPRCPASSYSPAYPCGSIWYLS